VTVSQCRRAVYDFEDFAGDTPKADPDVIPYRGGPPNLTVTSFEQFEVAASHTL
jgi:hypothetical protein